MPEHIRALTVILVLAMIFFAFARQPSIVIIDNQDFTRKRNLWLLLTITAFLSYNFWVFTFIFVLMIIYIGRYKFNPSSLFFFLLFLVPTASIPIPGFGLINYFFELNYVRLLTLTILLPAFLSMRTQSGVLPFGRNMADKILVTYLILTALLTFREANLTSGLRDWFYLFIDIFLPYYVVSRAIKNINDFKDALLSFVLATMLIALIAAFESSRHWLLYDNLISIWGMNWGYGYLARDGGLRATATAGHSIALGLIMVVGIGFFLFLKDSIKSKFKRRLGGVLLTAGLIAPLSRGPWVGAVALLLVFIATGPNAIRRLFVLGMIAIIALPLVASLPGGEKVINLLPFIGTTEKGSIDYREDLIKNATIVIKRNPLFGSVDYLNTPEMQSMMQGQGIIDVVNTYIGIALNSGFIGLGLFLLLFTVTLWQLYRCFKRLPPDQRELQNLGRSIFATLLAVLVIIFTASSILTIPTIYWSLAGLSVAYIQMLRKDKKIVAGAKNSIVQH